MVYSYSHVKSRSTCSPLGGDCFGLMLEESVQEFSNIPQTFNHLFMKEFLLFEGLGMPGVCSRGIVGVLLEGCPEKPVRSRVK